MAQEDGTSSSSSNKVGSADQALTPLRKDPINSLASNNNSRFHNSSSLVGSIISISSSMGIRMEGWDSSRDGTIVLRR